MKQVSSVAVDVSGLNLMLNYESKCLVFRTELLLIPFASSTNPAFVVKCCSPARPELRLYLLYSKYIWMKYKGTCRETSIPSCKLVQRRQTCKNVKDNSCNPAQASSTSSQFQILVWFSLRCISHTLKCAHERNKWKDHQWHQKAVDFELCWGLRFFYSYHAPNLLYLSKVQVQLFDVGCFCVPGVCACDQMCVSVHVWEREREREKEREDREGVCVSIYVCVPVAVSLMWQYVCTLAM